MNKNKSIPGALLLFLCIALLSSLTVQAGVLRVGVIYPYSDTGFKRVFEQIISGINSVNDIESFTFEASPSEDSPSREGKDLERWLGKYKPDVLITLGSRPVQLVKTLSSVPPMVSGAILGEEDDTYGMSLAGEPMEYLQRLKQLSPDTRRVFLVFQRQNSQWLIPAAESAAKNLGIELRTYPVESIKDGVVQLERVMAEASGTRDAIWLLNDGSMSERISLPRLLSASWNKHFVLFGSNPLQVKKGVLFALYPDYTEMGRNLVKLARHKFGHIRARGLQANTALKAAINKRTASHLGLSLGRKEVNEYNLVFPTR